MTKHPACVLLPGGAGVMFVIREAKAGRLLGLRWLQDFWGLGTCYQPDRSIAKGKQAICGIDEGSCLPP